MIFWQNGNMSLNRYTINDVLISFTSYTLVSTCQTILPQRLHVLDLLSAHSNGQWNTQSAISGKNSTSHQALFPILHSKVSIAAK